MGKEIWCLCSETHTSLDPASHMSIRINQTELVSFGIFVCIVVFACCWPGCCVCEGIKHESLSSASTSSGHSCHTHNVPQMLLSQKTVST